MTENQVDTAGLAAGSTELLIRQVSADLVQRRSGQLGSEAEPEMRDALREGVEHLRRQGLADGAIREHILRTFYSVRQRLFSQSEERPSAFWTVFEYIGGLPLIGVVVALMIPLFMGTGFGEAGSEFSSKALGHLLQLVIGASVALYIFLSQLDVSEGHLQIRRLLVLQKRVPLDMIRAVEFQKRHLLGNRRINVITGGPKIQLQSKTRGFHSAAFLLSFLPESVVPSAVRTHLRQAWFRVPLESSTFTYLAALGLVTANVLWYLHWNDIWEGNGVTWYSLLSMGLTLFIVTQMGMRVAGSARRGVLRFVTSYWLAAIFLAQGIMMGPHDWTRLSLYPLSLCISLPLLVLFVTERHLLVAAFACLSAFAGYKSVGIYKSMHEGLLFSTPGFVLELKQKQDGFAWIRGGSREREFFAGQLRNGQRTETALGEEFWLFIPSGPDDYIGLARDGTGSSIAKIDNGGNLELLPGAPERWLPARWNSDLIWYGSNRYLVTAIAAESTSPVRVVAGNLDTGEQNDFDGMGSCNIVRRVDDFQFEAIWFNNAAPRELKLMRYDVRTSAPQLIKSTALDTSEPVTAVHLPKSTCVLIQKPASGTSHRLILMDIATGTEHDISVIPDNAPYAWNSDKRLLAYAIEEPGGSILKLFDANSGKSWEKKFPARTRLRDPRISPDGTRLFYVTWRRGFPYIFGRMIKGEVWEFASGKVQGVYRPGVVQGILAVISSHRFPEHAPIQWKNNSRAIIAPELNLQPPQMRPGQSYYSRPDD